MTNVFERHKLKIARQTLAMPDALVGVRGGPSKEEARETIALHNALKHQRGGK